MIEDWIARVLSLAAALVILALSEPRINLMTPCARPGFRFAFITLALGAVWSIVELIEGVVPTWGSVVIRLGLAALLFEERRCPRNCQNVNVVARKVKCPQRRWDDKLGGHSRA